MDATTILRLTSIELRLRLHRPGSYLTLLGLVALCWAMVGAPERGYTMLSINEARVLYTSSTLALGAFSNLGALIVLVGFYFLRGRVAEDLRTGIAGPIAATAITNLNLLLSRWLSYVAYLIFLCLAFTATLLVRQTMVGEGTIQPWIYAQAGMALLAPAVVFTAAMATLWESIPWLMGKAGDVLYFIAALMFISLGAQLIGDEPTSAGALLAVDMTGAVTALDALFRNFHTTNFSLGESTFDASLSPILLGDQLWSASIFALRLVALLVAMTPMLFALWGFHRYSSDRVQAGAGAARRTPLEYMNAKLQFLGRRAQFLLAVARYLPGVAGQTLADLALTLVTAPVAIVLILLVNLMALAAPSEGLGAIAMFAFAAWGIVMCDLSTRDFASHTEGLTGALSGGGLQRFTRQWAATVLLGTLFLGVIMARWGMHEPTRALASVVGVLSTSALASLLGSALRTSRVFLVTFLLWLYVATNERKLPWLDIAGFNGSATGSSIAAYALMGLIALLAGLAINHRRRV